ncbi:hypothetical protein ACFL5O_12250, partial [Myxococcota bacterium]
WIDERKDGTHVRVVKVDRRLTPLGPERRLATTQGSATDLRLFSRDGRTLAVWSEANDPERPGQADLYLATLSNRDASLLVKTEAVAKTPAHSYSPTLGAIDGGLLLSWLESAGSTEQERAHVALAQLDPEGRPASARTRLPITHGTPSSLAMDCSGHTCRVMMAIEREHRAELWAATVEGEPSPPPKRLSRLGGPSGQSPPLVLLGPQLYYADLNTEGRGRVREMLVEW